jgi:Uma2 family endonuclease
MTIVTAKWSLQDYHQMIETGILDERRVELVNGEIIEMSPEGAPHSSYCGEIAEYLRRLLGNRAKVREAHPITLPDNSEPEPDIAIVRNRSTLYRDRHPYPEDIFWLIEIANSTLAKDLSMKKDLYANAGITEYWVLNLQASTLVVFRDLTISQGGDSANASYQSETIYTSGLIFPLAFQDLEIDIQQLLA